MTAELKAGKSKKTGEEYYYIDIELAPNYHKKCFLDSAELALVELTYKD